MSKPLEPLNERWVCCVCGDNADEGFEINRKRYCKDECYDKDKILEEKRNDN